MIAEHSYVLSARKSRLKALLPALIQHGLPGGPTPWRRSRRGEAKIGGRGHAACS